MLIQLFSSVQFSRSVMSESLWPHGLQHARPPCPLPTPGAYSNSCPLHWWCHPTLSSSVVSFPSCLESFPASGSFQMSQFFTSGGQGLEFQHQYFQWIFRTDFFRIDWLDLLAFQGTLESSPTPHFKSITSLALRFLYSPTLTSIRDYWKIHSFD